MGYKMPFGKHKGRELETLPIDYLEWLAEDDRELREPLATKVQEALAARRSGRRPGPEDLPAGAPEPPRMIPLAVLKANLGGGVEAVGTPEAVTAQAMASMSRALWAIFGEVRAMRHEKGDEIESVQ